MSEENKAADETNQETSTRETAPLPIAEEADKPMEVVEVSSVDILEAACREAIVCEFKYKGKLWRMTGRSLTPAEKDQVDLILERAMPDLLPPAPGEGQPKYNLRDPNFLAEKQKYKAQARALALFLSYPVISQNERVKVATKPKLQIDILTGVIQGFFTTEILDAMWDAAYGQSRVWDRVNFF